MQQNLNLGVAEHRVISLARIHDPRGNLTVIEGGLHVPFEIKRVYFLSDVPLGESRGGHAHRKLVQLIVAASGSFDVILDDGRSRVTVPLGHSGSGLLVPRMVWRELVNFSEGAVCAVLASEHYDVEDYYRDYGLFVAAVRDSPGSVDDPAGS